MTIGAPKIVRARWLLTGPGALFDFGGLLVRAGRVERVYTSASASRRAEARLGLSASTWEGLLAPGFVNAHAHLELSRLQAAEPVPERFADWVRGVIAGRVGATFAELRQAVREGAAELLAGGTTTVGDIDSSEASSGVLAAGGPRARVYRELLDAWRPERTAGALERVAQALSPRVTRLEGLSPHAPFTTSASLLEGVRSLRRRRPVPVAVHWSETEEEVRWLAEGAGPLAELLGPSPRETGLTLLRRSQLLGPHTSLIHGNHPARGERARVAESGATLVHCPGTHAYFGRDPFPFAAWRRAGVPLALGTDSRASNQALDMRRELRLLGGARGAPDPIQAFAMATTSGARALDLEEQVGRLEPGFWADMALHRWDGVGGEAWLEALGRGRTEVAGVWVAARRPRLGGPGKVGVPRP